MNKVFLRIVLVLFTLATYAQRTSSSPYSALGIGSEVQSKTVNEMAMGGVGTATNNGEITFSNPASYAALELSRYTLSAENRTVWLKDQSGSANVSNAYFSYLAIGIPVSKKGGFAFGTQLNSNVGYSIIQRDYATDGDLERTVTYEGEGGTNRLFFGFGHKIYKGLSLGLEGKYIFGKGKTTQTETKENAELSTRYHSEATGNGFGFKAGAIYKTHLEGSVYLNIGTSLEFENDLEILRDEYVFSIGQNIVSRDTILDTRTTGSYRTPLKTNLGVSIGDINKWELSADYSYRDAIVYDGGLEVNSNTLSYGAYQRAAVGGFYIPKINSLSNYWKRITYRAGLYYEETGLLVKTVGSTNEFTPIDDFGMSFGLGLPLGKRNTKLNTSFEYGQRGTLTNGLTKERYFNFRVALDFSAKWFKKRQIN